MRKLRLAILALALASPAAAQNAGWPPPAGAIAFLGVYNTAAPTLTNGQVGFAQLDVNGQLKVAASVSATVTGFLPSLSYNTCTATGSSCASTTLPTNTGSVILFNSGTTTVSCTMASGAATATASELQIPASSGLPLATTGYDHYACIDQTGSTSNVVVASGGSGLPTGWGGGGSGGGGGAITAASGSYSSGALASGSIASGAMVDLGAKADGACDTGIDTCSLIALVKFLNEQVILPVPWLASTSWTSNSYSNGTTAQGAADLHGAPFVDIGAINGVALLAGTGAQGTGSPRVTVATDQATNAGAALVKGGVGVVSGGSFYQAVAASQTAAVLQSSTGAMGDYLSHCVIYPTSTSPGAVTVFDSTNTAANSAILFAGGASSTSNLVPFAVPVGAVSVNGAWKVTTGSAVSAVCFGKFS